MSLVSLLILVGAVVVVLGLLSLVMTKQYKKVGPNEALIISGRKKTVTGPDGTKKKVGYRYRLGGGTFVMPFMETVDVLPMEVIPLTIRTPEVLTHGGVPILADAVAQVKVDSSDAAIRIAAEQFLGIGKDGIRDVATNVLEGKMREAIGTMTVEEIYRGRHEFNHKVADSARENLSKMGLVLLSFSLKEFSDTQGYIEALSKPIISAAKREAAIAEAESQKDAIIKSSQARKEGEVARLQAEAQIAKAGWENEGKKAESQVAVNQKKAQADFSYELERFKLSQEIKREEAKVKMVEKDLAIQIETLEIQRREKELEANVLKPSDARTYQIEGEAEAGRIRDKGLAEAEAMTKKAAAWDKYNEAAILEMYLKVLPEVVKAIAEPLARVDKIVVVGGSDKSLGTTKITAQIAEVLAQVPDVVKSLTGADIKKFLKDKLSPETKTEK
jgi:flotillin